MFFFVVLDCVNQEIDQSFVYIANELVSFLCALMLWFKLNELERILLFLLWVSYEDVKMLRCQGVVVRRCGVLFSLWLNFYISTSSPVRVKEGNGGGLD
jgi:hypothetical protein